MLLACGWQKCWGWSSSPGLGQQWGTGPPEAPKRGLCVLPSPHPWVLEAPSSPGSRRSCLGGSQALRMREQSLPAVLALQQVSCTSHLASRYLRDINSPFSGTAANRHPITWLFFLGKRSFLGRDIILLDFFPSVAALLSSCCPLQSQMKAQGTECICNSTGHWIFPRGSPGYF